MEGRPGGWPPPTPVPFFQGLNDRPTVLFWRFGSASAVFQKETASTWVYKIDRLSNGNSNWDFLLDVLFLCTCSSQNLLPARIVLFLEVEGHYHYWDGILPCLPAKLSMVKYIYQLRVALGQYRVETVTMSRVIWLILVWHKKLNIYNICAIIMMWCYGLWLVVAHDLLEYRYMEICFLIHVLLLFNVTRGFVGLIPRKKVQWELFTKKKNGETETKRAHDNLRISKLQEIFTTVAIVCRRYERILLWAIKDVQKLSKETV